MFATIASAALLGVDAYRVDIEIDVAGGLPAYHVVGMPAVSVKEGSTRIRSALRNSGQDLPPRKVTVNLAPAGIRKDGVAFDLPIAIGAIIAAGGLRGDLLRDFLVVGELGLDGAVRPVRGVLAAAALARSQGCRGIVVPAECAAEAAVISDLQVVPVKHLAEILRALEGVAPLPEWQPPAVSREGAKPPSPDDDFADVRGQDLARRAVEIAVAGGHNLLLYGPPGIGKTMLARRIPTILPPMPQDEALEVTRIYSAAGRLATSGLMRDRPFRAPHHTVSCAALIGGGSPPRPGEISLAHRGVLFLDELPEFSRASIEALRQPLEDRSVTIVRVAGTARLPASFHLVASANPCPCGWYGSDERTCKCTFTRLERYRARISGPVLDRIDLQVRVASVAIEQLRGSAPAESSAAIRERVLAARARQAQRLAPHGALVNAEMSVRAVRETCPLHSAAEAALGRLYRRRAGMTARGLDRIVRTARTIADLDGADVISLEAVLEAASYRALETDPIVDLRQPARPPAQTVAVA